MLKKIDHIGIAVNNLEEIIKTFELGFGIKPDFEAEIDDQQVRVVGFNIGESAIEYLQPISNNSPVTKFLEKRNNSIHHIAFCVEDLEAALNKLRARGFRLIDEKPRIGANGHKIAFLHPKSFNGILIELCEI
jgi:methylmalonyl-CoA/ethylmalonyl-CoA epimerase